MVDAVLSLNAGSSSLKFALHGPDESGALASIANGKIEGIGTSPHFLAWAHDGTVIGERRWDSNDTPSREQLLDYLLGWIADHLGADRLIGIGHRVVHGGAAFSAPVLVTQAVIARLDALCPLAPLHQPHNLAAIKATMAMRPGLPQVACFDTAFHQGQPGVATRFAIPRKLHNEGMRRYGFHGLSYEYVSRRLIELEPRIPPGRVIVAHLGNGASLCAMLNGRSIDTSMGFTALDGLMMGTRCGTIDPGLILYLQQAKGLSATQVQRLLYEQSGLLGVSGLSGDMRDLLDSKDPRASEAIELFIYRLTKEVGALVSILGGLDALVFTAGIGENAAEVRAEACRALDWIGIRLDEEANARHAPLISTADSKVCVRIVPTDEESMIATHTLDLVQSLRLAA